MMGFLLGPMIFAQTVFAEELTINERGANVKLKVVPDEGILDSQSGIRGWTKGGTWGYNITIENNGEKLEHVLLLINIGGASIDFSNQPSPSLCEPWPMGGAVCEFFLEQNTSTYFKFNVKPTIDPGNDLLAAFGIQLMAYSNPSLEEGLGITIPIVDVTTTADWKKICPVAKAVLGTELEHTVQKLREFRDNYVLTSDGGSVFMDTVHSYYYVIAPTITDWEDQNPLFKEFVKLFITPAITTFSILTMIEPNSDFELFLYMTGTVLLNLGIYFVFPAIVITKCGNKLKHN